MKILARSFAVVLAILATLFLLPSRVLAWGADKLMEYGEEL